MRSPRSSAAEQTSRAAARPVDRRGGFWPPLGCVTTSFTFDAELFEEQCLARFLSIQSNPNETANSRSAAWRSASGSTARMKRLGCASRRCCHSRCAASTTRGAAPNDPWLTLRKSGSSAHSWRTAWPRRGYAASRHHALPAQVGTHGIRVARVTGFPLARGCRWEAGHSAASRVRSSINCRVNGSRLRPYSIASSSGSKPRIRNVVTPRSW